jgi:ATP-binding cassette subfamily B protein
MEDTIQKINKENLYTGFKVLLRYLGQYKKNIFILSIMGILSAIGNGVIPYVAGKFFDAIIDPSFILVFGYTVSLYLFLLIVWSLVQLVTYTLDWKINITSEYLSNTIWLDYLSNGFGFLLNLPMSFHKKNKIGEIGNKINTAAGALETIAGRIVIDLAPQILSIVIALGIAIYLKPILAIVLIAGLVTYVFVLISKVKPLAGIQKDYWEQISFLWGDAFDVIGNTLAIKQATAERYEQKRIQDKSKLAVPL